VNATLRGLWLVGLGLASCWDPPRVLQGLVVKQDPITQILEVRDELPPNPVVPFVTDKAEVSAVPTVGDSVRIAYRTKDGRHIATRVMSLNRNAFPARAPP
jgi:hypothetical protein